MAKGELTLYVRAKNMLAAGLSSAGKSIRAFGSGVARMGKAAMVALGLVGAAAVTVGKRMVQAYQTQAAAEGKLAGVLKATGYAAGFTVSQLKKQAAELQKTTGVDDEVILSMNGILASFKNVGGVSFTRATAAILDMGAAMGKAGVGSADVESAVVQVGKALNDPIAGMSALSRVGVTFTDGQKAQVKALQESGDLMGAQAIILKELESEFGGTAKAVADAQHGIKQMGAAFGDAKEEIGRVIVESESFDAVIKQITESLQALIEDGDIELWAQKAQKALDSIAPGLSSVKSAVKWIGDMTAAAGTAAGVLSTKQMPDVKGSVLRGDPQGVVREIIGNIINSGDILSEIEDAIINTPGLVSEDRRKALAKIQGKKAAEEYLKGVAEAHEAAAAQAKANQPEAIAAAQAAKDAEGIADLSTRFSELAEKEKWNNLISEAEKGEQKKLELAKDAAELEVDIEKAKAQEIEDVNKKRWEDQAEEAQKAMEDARELANKRVDDVISEAKAKKDFAKAQEDDQKKAARLEKLASTGAVLSKKDREFVEAAKRIRDAGGAANMAQVQIDIAKNNLAELAKQTTVLAGLKKQLADNHAETIALQKMG